MFEYNRSMSTITSEPIFGRPQTAEDVAGVFARLRADLAAVASWVEDDAAGGLRLEGELLHQVMLGLVRLDRVLDAHTATVAEVWRNDGFWGLDGSTSAPAKLARETSRPLGSCRVILSRARKVHESMPATRTAWAAGAVTTEAVDLLTAANTAERESVFERDETMLVEQAEGLRYSEFSKTVQYWKNRADAELARDGTPPEPETFLSLTTTFDGAVSVSGVLDPIGGVIVEETLRMIEDELRRADDSAGITRATGTRRAAALVEMATRARTLPEGEGRRPVPLFTVILGEQTFADTCELFTGQVITPTDLRAWLNHATVQFFRFDDSDTPRTSDNPNHSHHPPDPVSEEDYATRHHDEFGSDETTRRVARDGACASAGGTPVSATRKQARFFTGALRTAIQLRDRHCQHPSGCDEPISRCDIDHTTPYSEGGITNLTSGRLLCTAHNRIPALRDPRTTRSQHYETYDKPARRPAP